MSDLVSVLAGKCGIDPEMARKGLGAVLGFFKEKLAPENFAKLRNAVPESEEMVAESEAPAESSGGLFGVIGGIVGQLTGGAGVTGLMAKLAQFGFSPAQIQAFVPRVLEQLKGRIPDSVLQQIAGWLPQTEEAPTE